MPQVTARHNQLWHMYRPVSAQLPAQKKPLNLWYSCNNHSIVADTYFKVELQIKQGRQTHTKINEAEVTNNYAKSQFFIRNLMSYARSKKNPSIPKNKRLFTVYQAVKPRLMTH